jgi:hypothetical protein
LQVVIDKTNDLFRHRVVRLFFRAEDPEMIDTAKAARGHGAA